MRFSVKVAAIIAFAVVACEVSTPTGPDAPPRVLAVTAPTATYAFYDCIGPSGTPTAFTAVKTAVPLQSGAPVSAAAAFRLTDDSAIFVVLRFDTAFSPPGINHSGNATITCSVNINGEVFYYSGLLAPR